MWQVRLSVIYLILFRLISVFYSLLLPLPTPLSHRSAWEGLHRASTLRSDAHLHRFQLLSTPHIPPHTGRRPHQPPVQVCRGSGMETERERERILHPYQHLIVHIVNTPNLTTFAYECLSKIIMSLSHPYSGDGRRPPSVCFLGSGAGTCGQTTHRRRFSYRPLGPASELSLGQVLHASTGEGQS